jgi:hypothetical protein
MISVRRLPPAHEVLGRQRQTPTLCAVIHYPLFIDLMWCGLGSLTSRLTAFFVHSVSTGSGAKLIFSVELCLDFLHRILYLLGTRFWLYIISSVPLNSILL